MNYLNLSKENILEEHICCAISDKKCSEGYALKDDMISSVHRRWYARV